MTTPRHPFHLALVTGAGSGIGEALCELLASERINLIINGRNQAKLNELASRLRQEVEVTVLLADLAHPPERAVLVKKIYEAIPDLVINNAGFGLYGEALTYETQTQMEILEVNGNAVLDITLEASRAMISANRKGVIMNISSAAAMQTSPCLAIYAASKALVNHFSQSLDYELSPHGVRVLVACPGMVQTQFRVRAGGFPSHKQSRQPIMSAPYAAQEIWRQIEKRKPLRVFDWKYRLITFLSQYLLPKKWVADRICNEINRRHPHRNLITRSLSIHD
jgi:short-subunit dehydrogenase